MKKTTPPIARGRWTARNATEAGEFFGVSVSTIRQWLAEGCPGAAGHYDLAEMVAWEDQRRMRSHRKRLGGHISDSDFAMLTLAREELARIRRGQPAAGATREE